MAMDNSLICDTNVLVYFIDGNKSVGKLFEKSNVIFSSITYVEILSNKQLLPHRRDLIRDFLRSFTVIETSPQINEFAVDLRLNYSLDTPDSIIAATAKYLNTPLATADSAFYKIKELEIIKFPHKK